ncbi:hypothetical protein [Chryseolinea sp. H1M3-3]|uniref:hypothetical protein n=1 Tax=Chryseolinea sp. H1M3-3 TaxID=3034144 RepID=UPI0023ED068F|nr:hypothetical protein [Chryseolinea sp. H1M3-3]
MEKYFALLLLTLTIKAKAQAPLDSVKLFKDFELHGRTTASAYTHFTDLIHEGRKTKLISSTDLQTLNSLILDSKIKKHKQTKFGLDNIFILGYYNRHEDRIIIAGGQRIINLTSRQEYQLSENQKIELKQMTDSWKE